MICKLYLNKAMLKICVFTLGWGSQRFRLHRKQKWITIELWMLGNTHFGGVIILEHTLFC